MPVMFNGIAHSQSAFLTDNGMTVGEDTSVNIYVRTYFGDSRQALDGEPDLEVELDRAEATVSDLLNALSTERYGGSVITTDPQTGTATPDLYLLSLNGGPWEFLSGRLETAINSGDKVWFARLVEMIGGG